jgi:hypothetical protein
MSDYFPLPAEWGSIHLLSGKHAANDGKEMCAMEAAAWIAREPWTDHPTCVPPVLATFLRSWNDALPDNKRDILKPYIPRLIGLPKDTATEERRSWMAMDWLTRECAPAWLDLAGLTTHAEAMRNLSPIVDRSSLDASVVTSEAAREAAREAAWEAARGAAWEAASGAAWGAAWEAASGAAWGAAWEAASGAAWVAARGAAWGAAWEAASGAAWGAAWEAASGAAWGAAWEAASGAASGAAWERLMPTRDRLIDSALALLERMIAA